jgi:hypothetical protein
VIGFKLGFEESLDLSAKVRMSTTFYFGLAIGSSVGKAWTPIESVWVCIVWAVIQSVVSGWAIVVGDGVVSTEGAGVWAVSVVSVWGIVKVWTGSVCAGNSTAIVWMGPFSLWIVTAVLLTVRFKCFVSALRV